MKRIVSYLNPKVVAVTGGIGSGQSTVSGIFKSLGSKVIDVDNKAQQIIRKDIALQKEMIYAFGKDIFYSPGKLNRKLLASIVFKDEEKVLQLNRLVHPRMVAEVVEEMESARFSQRYPLIVVDAALIFEVSIEQMFDAVIVVYADLEIRINRVCERDKMKREEVNARINKQIPLEDKREWADFVIDNNGSLENTTKQVKKVFTTLMKDVRTSRKIRV